MNIGVFDSGFGGLSILKQIVRILGEYSYVYLGDNARAPYGGRSQDVIYEFTRQGVEFLFNNDCSLVILACNTATASALRRLQQEWLPVHHPDRRILGIIIPVVEALGTNSNQGPVGIIGTRATVASQAYIYECNKRCPQPIQLIQQACPLLVPLIEEGWEHTAPMRMILKRYLRPLKLKKIRVLILGCTHYTFLFKTIHAIMGRRVRILDSGTIVAHSLLIYLKRHPEIDNTLSKKTLVDFYTTALTPRAKELAARFWGSALNARTACIDS
ncbi:MAG: glutamate racemase [Patescibacteria group bacterium]